MGARPSARHSPACSRQTTVRSAVGGSLVRWGRIRLRFIPRVGSLQSYLLASAALYVGGAVVWESVQERDCKDEPDQERAWHEQFYR
jgi:hypothetical protein